MTPAKRDSPAPALSALVARLGYSFHAPERLQQALTHRSTGQPRLESNERLEFLGDRVLGLVLADLLYQTFPNEPEGALGVRFTNLARKETLAKVAETLSLGPHLILGPGEDDQGGRRNAAILADACEAILGAVYLDGGLEPAARLIRTHWTPYLAAAPAADKDAKTRLQEWAQGRGLALPAYREQDRTGPDHAPVFTVQVTVEGYAPADGSGASKRAAEQAAALALLTAVEGPA